MNKSLTLYLSILLITINTFLSYSQKMENDTINVERTENILYQSRKNLLKINLTSLAFRNYQFQAERVITRAISINFTFATIPKGSVPFKNQILNLIDEEDDELANMLNSASISYTSYIPEIRFYLAKGFGKGFYIAPFYKNSKYEIENAEILEFERDDGSFERLVTDGEISANTFGILLGSQFNLGQRIVLDWWIMGPNFGTHSGELSGEANRPLSPNEQILLKDQLEDLNIPLSDTTIEISSGGAELDNQGNWGGVRAGISLGVRF